MVPFMDIVLHVEMMQHAHHLFMAKVMVNNFESVGLIPMIRDDVPVYAPLLDV